MLPGYINFRAEKNLGGGRSVLEFGLHKLADDRHIQLTDQISHENKAVFHDPDDIQGLSAEVFRYLAGKLLHTFLDFIGRQDHPRVLWQNFAHSLFRSRRHIQFFNQDRFSLYGRISLGYGKASHPNDLAFALRYRPILALSRRELVGQPTGLEQLFYFLWGVSVRR